jgi:phospholipid/cholesterol/gamma-HCH transport system permease protein
MSESSDSPQTEASPTGVSRWLAAVGEPVVEVAAIVRGVFRVFGLTIYYLIYGERRWRAVLEQMYEIGNRSLIFIAVTLGFLGMILVFQAGYQANRITGDLTLLGPLFLQLLLREFAPTITAMMLATRVGTGMAAHIGSMVVTEQVDALRMSAAQPVDYLVVPRFLASIVMTTTLTVFGGLVSYAAGAVTAHSAFGVSFYTFVDASMTGWFDLIIGLVKSLAYGLAIPITACHAGLTVFGGSAGVGRATTRAVVHSSMAVVILDFLISGAGFVVLAAIS